MRLVQFEHAVGHHGSRQAFFDRIWLWSKSDRIEHALKPAVCLDLYVPNPLHPFQLSTLPQRFYPSTLPLLSRISRHLPIPSSVTPNISILLYSSIPNLRYQPGNQIVTFPVRRVQGTSYYPLPVFDRYSDVLFIAIEMISSTLCHCKLTVSKTICFYKVSRCSAATHSENSTRCSDARLAYCPSKRKRCLH